MSSPEETPRKQGYTMCFTVFDVYYRPVFSESLLGFEVSSGELRHSPVRYPLKRSRNGRSAAEGSLEASKGLMNQTKINQFHLKYINMA